MTLSLMRPALVLALALGLASCGGKAEFPIAGSVTGLTQDSLELSSNGMKITVNAPAATSTLPVAFKFPDPISYGDGYKVEIKKPAAHQSCTVVNGTDTAGRLATIDVIINCAPSANTITGKVVTLTSKGLVLANGSTGGTVAPTPEAPTFTFPAIPYGQTYGITVQSQPNDPTIQTCTVTSANGVGTMDDQEVTGVEVTCQ